mgnify:CR=1 FL=1
MELIKKILFFWLLIYDIMVITIKPIRKNLIDFLRKMDNWKNKIFNFFGKYWN